MIKRIVRPLILSTLVIVGVLGIVFTATSTAFMGGKAVFLFFTVQSNIFIILMALIALINEIVSLTLEKPFMNQILLHIKFVATVAITITFIVFFTMLAPSMGVDYLLSFNNFSLHAIVPILAIVDFIIFDTDIKLTYPKSLVGTAMPLYYVIFVYIGVPLNFQYGQDLKFPYFFLDYDTNGFFFEKGFGVILWIIVMLIGICGLCLLFCFFIRLRQKAVNKALNGGN